MTTTPSPGSIAGKQGGRTFTADDWLKVAIAAPDGTTREWNGIYQDVDQHQRHRRPVPQRRARHVQPRVRKAGHIHRNPQRRLHVGLLRCLQVRRLGGRPLRALGEDRALNAEIEAVRRSREDVCAIESEGRAGTR
jgi:hypothetical protein